MTGWKPRRSWAEARAEPAPGGFGVQLDGRGLRTPAKAALVVPSRALAEAIAAEWQEVESVVRPAEMPLTRAANAAIDKVAVQHAEVVAAVAAYGASDLLCYRAEAPESLAARQAAAWDPLLDWAAETLVAPLSTTSGLAHCPQPEASLARLHGSVAALDAFALTALSELVSLSGSLVIGLAALARQAPGAALWEASRIDEAWQEEHWGSDPEAVAAAAEHRAAFLSALHFHALCTEM
ncbi:MAG: ATPase [Alphaproteobacteria bacterium HGW-Alphaproteobacteria-2]|nr:MAG: ATPase [Alphaproteobacteria bacterium HGW-Alphaproteobacteria-2]